MLKNALLKNALLKKDTTSGRHDQRKALKEAENRHERKDDALMNKTVEERLVI